MQEKCENCKYWKELGKAEFEGGNKKSGQCRRHPPGRFTSDKITKASYMRRFPLSAVDDWCGEYKPGSGD
jgi:hypothetical protein